MSFGGGTWVAQNKVLPGAYINFISLARASSALSARGICAMAVSLSWGPEGVFELTAEDFRDKTMELLGYDYTADEMRDLRELFAGAQSAYLYRLNGGGVKAANAFATAKYAGARGNDLQIVIEESADGGGQYDVMTYLGPSLVETQTVPDAQALVPNVYVDFKTDATLEATAGTPLLGGTDMAPTNEQHQQFLSALESYSFNTLGCAAQDSTLKALYVAYTKRMRDDYGIKFQTVLHRYPADYEGVISVENNETPELVYWVTGMEAGCAVNASLTNTVYSGEHEVSVDYTQKQLEQAIRGGKLIFHRAYHEARVLTDINTLVTLTDVKGKVLTANQTMRVIDQIGNDIAVLFNTKYLGKMPSNDSGRVSLWGDIVAHHRELEALQAIENFDPDLVTVQAGEERNAVLVGDEVTPVNAMEKLYMAAYIR